MEAYKITNKNGICNPSGNNPQEYEVGETYTFDGEIKLCESGFHWSKNPMDALSYHDLYKARFFIVTPSGEIIEGEDKGVSSVLKVERELTLKQFIDHSVDFLSKNNNPFKLASSGDYSQLASSGDYSQLASSLDNSRLASSGYNSKLASSGYNSKLAASGYYSKLAASGYYSKLAASGDYSKLAASGYSSQLTASGNYSQLASSGEKSIVAGIGYQNRVKVSNKNSFIVIFNYDNNFKPIEGFCKKPGQKIKGIIIKINHWYWFKNGQLMEEKEK